MTDEHFLPRRRFDGQVIVGTLIAIAGLLFLLRNLGVPVPHLGHLWPLFLVALGVVKLQVGRGRSFSGWFLLVIGVLFQLQELRILPVPVFRLWPILLVAAGLRVVWRGFAGYTPPRARIDSASTDSVLNESAAFGGGERKLSSPDFKGGHVSVAFGGFDIDLSDCAIRNPEVAIEVLSAFGGVDFKVPPSWNVTLRVVSVFGGADDKTVHPADPAAPRLVITGSTVFGGVEISNSGWGAARRVEESGRI
jgi:predicted membrane protein